MARQKFAGIAVGIIAPLLTPSPSAVSAGVLVQGSASSNKGAASPALRKIDSQLVIELDRWRQHRSAPKTGVRLDKKHRAWADIRAEVTPELLDELRALGSAIVMTSIEYRSIVGWVPLEHLERIAALKSVHAIRPAAEPVVRR